MAEDMLPEVRRIINERGQFYGLVTEHTHMHNVFIMISYLHTECPNGHSYFVGEVSEVQLLPACLSLHSTNTPHIHVSECVCVCQCE